MILKKFTFLTALLAVTASACAMKSADNGSAIVPAALPKHPGVMRIAYEFKEPGGAVDFAREDEFVFCGDCVAPAPPEPALKADLRLGVPAVTAEAPVEGSRTLIIAEAKPNAEPSADNPPAQAVGQAPASTPPAPARQEPFCGDKEQAPVCGEPTPVAVLFGFNSARLTADKVDVRRLPKDLVYRITGFTDDKGGLKVNEKVASPISG